tara:strand:+ start:901 stop:1626 length:726 start_codon:yes stop_codon:yes gene_type:complete
METREIRTFYNSSLQNSDNNYEYDRWQKTPQGRAGFLSTKDALIKYVLPQLEEKRTVLEVGAGPGTWSKFLLEKTATAPYDIVDISDEMLKQAKANLSSYSNVQFIRSDILEFIPEKEYDFFFSSRFIEYVDDKLAVAKIISASLKSGGRGYLVTKTPHYNKVLRKRNVSLVHQGQISANELSVVFEEVGLEVDCVVNVTSVFPGLGSGYMDRFMTLLCNLFPYAFVKGVSESYAIIFHKI